MTERSNAIALMKQLSADKDEKALGELRTELRMDSRYEPGVKRLFGPIKRIEVVHPIKAPSKRDIIELAPGPVLQRLAITIMLPEGAGIEHLPLFLGDDELSAFRELEEMAAFSEKSRNVLPDRVEYIYDGVRIFDGVRNVLFLGRKHLDLNKLPYWKVEVIREHSANDWNVCHGF